MVTYAADGPDVSPLRAAPQPMVGGASIRCGVLRKLRVWGRNRRTTPPDHCEQTRCSSGVSVSQHLGQVGQWTPGVPLEPQCGAQTALPQP
jgi:hypothetical protein